MSAHSLNSLKRSGGSAKIRRQYSGALVRDEARGIDVSHYNVLVFVTIYVWLSGGVVQAMDFVRQNWKWADQSSSSFCLTKLIQTQLLLTQGTYRIMHTYPRVLRKDVDVPISKRWLILFLCFCQKGWSFSLLSKGYPFSLSKDNDFVDVLRKDRRSDRHDRQQNTTEVTDPDCHFRLLPPIFSNFDGALCSSLICNVDKCCADLDKQTTKTKAPIKWHAHDMHSLRMRTLQSSSSSCFTKSIQTQLLLTQGTYRIMHTYPRAHADTEWRV